MSGENVLLHSQVGIVRSPNSPAIFRMSPENCFKNVLFLHDL